MTIAYRRRLIDSPSYTLGHEEVEKALEEGIVFADGPRPLAVDVDEYGAAKGIRLAEQRLGDDGKLDEAGATWLPAETDLRRRRHPAEHRARARETPPHLDGRRRYPRLR